MFLVELRSLRKFSMKLETFPFNSDFMFSADTKRVFKMYVSGEITANNVEIF